MFLGPCCPRHRSSGVVGCAGPGWWVPALVSCVAVAGGIVDAGWGCAGWFAQSDIAFNVCSAVPFGPGIGEYVAWLYYGGGLEMAREMFAEHDLYNLPCALIPPEASGWFRREIRSVADLRGLRMRFFGLEIGRASCRERVCQYV